MERPVDVLVVGAGLAGLSAAATAARAGATVQVLDATVPGGRARTDEVGGFRFNRGPHALYRGGAGRQVLDRLGLRLTGGQPPARGGRAAVGGRLVAFPGGAADLLRSPLLSPRSKVQAGSFLARLGRVRATGLETTSVTGWFDQLDLRDDVRALVAALVRLTTYQDDLDRTSADAVLPQLQAAVATGVDYLDGGWQRIVDGLAGVVIAGGGTIERGSAQQVDAESDGTLTVHTHDRSFTARSVVLAAGGPDATRRLAPVDPGWRLVGPDATMACLDLGLRRLPDHRFVLGIDQPTYFSVHHPPADLAPEGRCVAHVGVYGAAAGSDERETLDAAARRAGVHADDVERERYLHHMVVAHRYPSPETGGLAGRPGAAVAGSPGLFVAGDWVGPVGLIGDAALASGEQAGLQAAACTVRAGTAA